MQQLGAGDRAATQLESPLAMQAFCALILDTVAAAIVLIAKSGHIVYCNNEVNRLFGYKAGELLGQPLEKLCLQPFARR